MKVIQSDPRGFSELSGYKFVPNFLQVTGDNETPVRIHYIDEGPRDGQPIVLLHGNPSWSYSYRNLIPVLAKAGFRVLAPDLVGLGRSDKPMDLNDYSIAQHLKWLNNWFIGLALEQVILVCQDWGGMLGLSIASQNAERFAGILVTNTGLYHEGVALDTEQMAGVEAWANLAQSSPDFPFEYSLATLIKSDLSEAELAAYSAPYPTPEHKGALRSFPQFIPVLASGTECREESLATWQRLESWTKPMMLAFSDEDPLTASFEPVFRRRVPGTQGEKHVTIRGGGHIVQEDCPAALSDAILSFAERCQR